MMIVAQGAAGPKPDPEPPTAKRLKIEPGAVHAPSQTIPKPEQAPAAAVPVDAFSLEMSLEADSSAPAPGFQSQVQCLKPNRRSPLLTHFAEWRLWSSTASVVDASLLHKEDKTAGQTCRAIRPQLRSYA